MACALHPGMRPHTNQEDAMRQNLRLSKHVHEPPIDYEGHAVLRWVLMAMLCLVVACWGLFVWAIWPA